MPISCFDCGTGIRAPEPVINYVVPRSNKKMHHHTIQLCQKCADKRNAPKPIVHHYEQQRIVEPV